jgi:hypothetical protein|tara:strand:+ start:1873 stop:2148 length:276 start_codon:yes stop_codon:yes gene_type:complete
MEDNNNEMTGVTPQMLDHTNMQGDVSNEKKHFAEISFDGFRICLSTSEEMPLVDFNDELLRFWTRLDEFMMDKQKERMKVSKKKGQDQHYG